MEKDEAPAIPSQGNRTAQKIASAFGWIIGVIMLLVALVMFFFSSDAAGGAVVGRLIGLAFASTGTLLLPPVVRAIRRWVPLFNVPGLPAFLAVVVGIAFFSAAGSTAPDPTNAPTRGQVAAAKLVARKIGPSDEVKTQVNAAWLELSRITQPCDAAAGVFSKALEGGSAGSVTAYRVASQAKSICANAGLDVLGVSVPKGLSPPHRKAFRDALAGCGAAYAGRSVMYGEMMKVLDGDRRPSQLARVQTAADTSQNEVVQCGLNVVAVAKRVGVELPST